MNWNPLRRLFRDRSHERLLGVDMRCTAELDVQMFRDAPDDKPVATSHRLFPDEKVHHPSAPETEIALDETFRRGIMASFDQSGLSVPVDFNHRSAGLFDAPTYDDGAAAGWITKLDDRGAEGLHAHVEWNARGLAAIRSREYRYLSPEFTLGQFDKKSGKKIKTPRLLAVALTNRPFFENQQQVAASAPATKEQPVMAAEPTITPAPVAALAPTAASAEPDAAVALRQRNAELEAQLKANDSIFAETRKRQREEIITKCSDRVPPASLDAVRAFGDALDKDPKHAERLETYLLSLPVVTREKPAGADAVRRESTAGDENAKLAGEMGVDPVWVALADKASGVFTDGRIKLRDGRVVTMEQFKKEMN